MKLTAALKFSMIPIFILLLLTSCNWFKEKEKSSDEQFAAFKENFPEIKLPYNIDEIIIAKRLTSKLTDLALIEMFIEKNTHTQGASRQFDWYNYYAVSRFKINDRYTCFIYLKERKFGDFASEYYLNIYSNKVRISGLLIGLMSGNCKDMTMVTSSITKDNVIYTFVKNITYSDDCKTIKSSKILSEKDYHIDKTGNIIQNQITVGNAGGTNENIH